MIKTILSNLPRYAEENGDFYSVSRQELTNILCLEKKVAPEIAMNTIQLIENVFDTLAILDQSYLEKDEWCFVSFPAQLLAMSLLTAMCDKESHFFDKNFWNTRDISNDKKDQQRNVLKYIENQRVNCYLTQNPMPIRYIYVAWAIIKLDNQILLYQREDTKKRYDKTAGDYGLIGGRLNQNDMQSFSGDIRTCLKILQSDNVELLKGALSTTLKRELLEETGLEFETHYTFEPWLNLEPYHQVQGAAPNHAYTQYHFEIFKIKLTLKGYLFLHQKIKWDERLVWFSIDEIIAGQRTDGKIAYLNALSNHFKNNSQTLKDQLYQLNASFDEKYQYAPERINHYILIIPKNNEKSILLGLRGQENPLHITLSERQLDILLGLATHNRSFAFENINEAITLHPNGWIEVNENSCIKEELSDLSTLFSRLEIIIENQDNKFFRLSVIPPVIHFDDTYFNYSVSANDLEGIRTRIDVILTRLPIKTAFGTVIQSEKKFTISLDLATGLKKLVTQKTVADNDEAIKIEDNCSKTFSKKEDFLSLGLKSLVRRENGIMRFCIEHNLLH
jgi:8-oxo-dGTP pyrophosphatase MutT (NUDIX family)